MRHGKCRVIDHDRRVFRVRIVDGGLGKHRFLVLCMRLAEYVFSHFPDRVLQLVLVLLRNAVIQADDRIDQLVVILSFKKPLVSVVREQMKERRIVDFFDIAVEVLCQHVQRVLRRVEVRALLRVVHDAGDRRRQVLRVRIDRLPFCAGIGRVFPEKIPDRCSAVEGGLLGQEHGARVLLYKTQLDPGRHLVINTARHISLQWKINKRKSDLQRNQFRRLAKYGYRPPRSRTPPLTLTGDARRRRHANATRFNTGRND